MNNAVPRLFILLAFIIITLLLMGAFISISDRYKQGYASANRKYESISYVEKDPVRDEYPFEDTNY